MNAKFVEYTLPQESSAPYAITRGKDGNMWFTENKGNRIGRITPEGEIKEFAVPTTNAGLSLIVSSNEELWFTENKANKIGKINMEGRIIEFQLPLEDAGPFGITIGKDDAIWFTEITGNKIGRMTKRGEFSEFALPSEGFLHRFWT